VDDTDGNICVVYVWYGVFFIPVGSVQNSEFAKKACVYSGTEYIFPVLFRLISCFKGLIWSTFNL
jgi:hypothetical protein